MVQAIGLFGDQRGTVRYAQSFDEAARQVSAVAEPGDMVLTLGAGSVSQLGPMVLEQLRKKQAEMKEAASY